MNKPLHLSDGWLVIRDNMNVPKGLEYDYTYSEKQANGFYEGSVFLNNAEGVHYFLIASPAAIDENGEKDNTINLNYRIEEEGAFNIYVPITWLNDSQRSYPLIIDPFVSATSILPVNQNPGSGYNANCFTGGCKHDLDVQVPPACTVTDIINTFWYRALGTCTLDSGAWDLTLGACHYPSMGSGVSSCSAWLPGLCRVVI